MITPPETSCAGITASAAMAPRALVQGIDARHQRLPNQRSRLPLPSYSAAIVFSSASGRRADGENSIRLTMTRAADEDGTPSLRSTALRSRGEARGSLRERWRSSSSSFFCCSIDWRWIAPGSTRRRQLHRRGLRLGQTRAHEAGDGQTTPERSATNEHRAQCWAGVSSGAPSPVTLGNFLGMFHGRRGSVGSEDGRLFASTAGAPPALSCSGVALNSTGPLTVRRLGCGTSLTVPNFALAISSSKVSASVTLRPAGLSVMNDGRRCST